MTLRLIELARLTRGEVFVRLFSEIELQRECRIHHQLRHPHIVQFFDQGRAGNLLYIATEYLPAVRLSDRAMPRRTVA